MKTPCIGVCQLDDNQMCKGCGRHAREIAGWSRMTDVEREIIMDRCTEQGYPVPPETTSHSRSWR